MTQGLANQRTISLCHRNRLKSNYRSKVEQTAYPQTILMILAGNGILSMLKLLNCWDVNKGDKLCIFTNGVNVENSITEK